MSYRWTNGDIGVIQKHLREKNDNKTKVTAALLELMPTLKTEEIEIAEQDRKYEKGELPLEKLLENRARLGLNQKEANRYDHI